MEDTLKLSEFAARLKKERLVNKKTQKEVAKAIGISLSQYVKYEKGIKKPKIEFIVSLREIDFDINYILTGLSWMDISIKNGLEKMPDNLYDLTINKLTEAIHNYTKNNKDLTVYKILDKIMVYGNNHIEDKSLRMVPEIKLFTNIKEFNI